MKERFSKKHFAVRERSKFWTNRKGNLEKKFKNCVKVSTKVL